MIRSSVNLLFFTSHSFSKWTLHQTGGVSGEHVSWHGLIDHLGEDHRCILVDLPGHGASDDFPEADYDFRAVAARLHAIVAELEIGPPLIVGQSMGGVIGACYANAFPNRGLLLLDQPLDVAAFVKILRDAYAAGGGAALLEIWNAVKTGFAIEDLSAEARSLLEESTRPTAELLTGYWRPLLDREPEAFQHFLDAILSGIRAPCRVAHAGERNEAYEVWLRQRLPQAQFRWIPGGTHFPQLKCPQEIAEIVRAMNAAP